MPIEQITMYWLLLAGTFSMTVLAVLYLRRRKLSLLAYTIWGVIAIIFPLVGPFFVIWCRPGHLRLKQT